MDFKAIEQALYANSTDQEHKDLLEELGDEMDGEMVRCFHDTEERLPRTAQELDCYASSVEEFAAFMAANPVS